MKLYRKIAVLLTMTLLFGSMAAGCSGDGGSAQTDNSEEVAPATALEAMQDVNPTGNNSIDDNYRTWYEVFVYSFYDSDGDGIGDLQGLIQNLDYINDGDDTTDTDLGCNGIWLMPIMPSPTYHKYDITDYYDIDSQYGTLDDFAELIDECHERGINVIIDLVINHTSSSHPWFKAAYEYIQSLGEGEEPDADECPYIDYYNFTTKNASGYSAVAGTEWYYEAQFWSEMPDLNLDSDAVRAEIEQIVDFWFDMGVDGFRLDAVTSYYTGQAQKNIDVLTWFNTMVKEKKSDAYLVAETWIDMNSYAKYYASGIDSCFDFAFADNSGIIANTVKKASGYTASSYGESIITLQELLSEYSNSIDAPFYSNHDMSRSAGYYAGDYSENQTKMGHALNLLMSGSAFIYYGEELGMKGSGDDENKRAPMYWSTDATAEGMCDGSADMDDITMKYGSYEEQSEDGDSIYSFVKEAIGLRNAYPAIARGTAEFIDDLSDDNICVLRKTYEGEDGTEELILVFNISETEQTVDISGLTLSDGSELSLGGVLVTTAERVKLDDGALTLPMYSVAVLTK